VHVSQDVSADRTRTPEQTVDALEDLVRVNPDQATSRVVSPRRLDALTPYTAFLVPAFEVGRQAGLGIEPSGDGQAASWGAGQVEYPVYYEWSFGTSEQGDFEYLVGLLKARPVDDRVGIRDMDVQQPGFGVTGLSDPPVMGLEGALRKPGAVARPATWPPAPPPQMLEDLATVVNLQEDLLAPASGTGHPDPVISPPLYGRWHAIVDRLDLDGTGWVHELNRDPRLRVPAGYGAEVTATGAEGYMTRAWAQLGDLELANQRIRQAQLGLAAAKSLHRRHLSELESHELLATTRLVHGRLVTTPPGAAQAAVTLRAAVDGSRLTRAATSPAARRLTRPRGRLARRLLPGAERRPSALLPRLDEGGVTAAPPKEAPPGQLDVDDLASELRPNWIPDWLARLLPYRWWIVAALAVLAVVLAFVTVALGVVVGLVAVAAAVAAVVLGRTAVRLDAAEASEEGALTRASVDAVPARPRFTVTTRDNPTPPPSEPGGARRDSAQGARFRAAAGELHERFELELPASPVRGELGAGGVRAVVLRGLDPVRTVPARLATIVHLPESLPQRPTHTIVPVMAHPVFADPMYAPLRDLSADLLIPNLRLIPEDTISLLETNRDFIEAYMVGLNHEMARELRFNEFPTDLRPSSFRQFWDVADIVERDASKTPAEIEESRRDIAPLHEWAPDSALGTHESRLLPRGEPDEGRLVLVVKGRLLKKYPTTVIFAQRGRWDTDELGRRVRVLDESDPATNRRDPAFAASIEPGLRFIGFDLKADEVPGSTDPDDDDAGWFFVLQERPGEPRFGLDLPDADTPDVPAEWDDLAWGHVTVGPRGAVSLTPAPTTNITEHPDSAVAWGTDAAAMAYVLFQAPAMVAFHAADMLDEEAEQ
jgi:hypothetical protein